MPDTALHRARATQHRRAAGLKVLALGQLGAGPFAGPFPGPFPGTTLADFAAVVIKLEPRREGDPLRQWHLLHQGSSAATAEIRHHHHITTT